jgi:hypothetical protein
MAIAAPVLTDEDIQQQAVNELTWDAWSTLGAKEVENHITVRR